MLKKIGVSKVLEFFEDEVWVMSVRDETQYKILALKEFQIIECEVSPDQAEILCEKISRDEFTLTGGKLIHTEIIHIKNSDEVILNLTQHHILSDAYSLELMASEILSTYLKLSRNETLDLIRSIDYFDYVAYQQYELQTERCR
jgi:hypothetical protein